MAQIFKNFGFLWEKQYLYRGRGRNKGHLIGISRSDKDQLVDFREQIGVYALYDKNEQIIYIGQAGKGQNGLFNRLKQHQTDRLWNRWEYFSWVGFYPVSDEIGDNGAHKLVISEPNDQISDYRFSDALKEVEAVLIELVEPKLNRKGSFLGSRKYEFLQYVSEEETADQQPKADTSRE